MSRENHYRISYRIEVQKFTKYCLSNFLQSGQHYELFPIYKFAVVLQATLI